MRSTRVSVRPLAARATEVLAMAALVAACASPADAPSASAAPEAKQSASAERAEKLDQTAACASVTSAFEIDDQSHRRGIEAANIFPESPNERDAALAIIDRGLGRWRELEPRVSGTKVGEIAAGYVKALEGQRARLASIHYRFLKPTPPEPPPPLSAKPRTSAELAREIALRDAAEYGMLGKVATKELWVAPVEDRKSFQEGRGGYLDAWEPLVRLCEPAAPPAAQSARPLN